MGFILLIMAAFIAVFYAGNYVGQRYERHKANEYYDQFIKIYEHLIKYLYKRIDEYKKKENEQARTTPNEDAEV